VVRYLDIPAPYDALAVSFRRRRELWETLARRALDQFRQSYTWYAHTPSLDWRSGDAAMKSELSAPWLQNEEAAFAYVEGRL
jgi:hypothetical protein